MDLDDELLADEEDAERGEDPGEYDEEDEEGAPPELDEIGPTFTDDFDEDEEY